MVAWLHGCMDAWMHGCMERCSHAVMQFFGIIFASFFYWSHSMCINDALKKKKEVPLHIKTNDCIQGDFHV
jgi:hypothetical protein